MSESEEHVQKIDTLLPNDKLSSLLAQSARDLWKKWIILKMVFIIPKLERPKDGISLIYIIILEIYRI